MNKVNVVIVLSQVFAVHGKCWSSVSFGVQRTCIHERKKRANESLVSLTQDLTDTLWGCSDVCSLISKIYEKEHTVLCFFFIKIMLFSPQRPN